MKPARCGGNGRKMMPEISRHLIWYSAFVFITSAQIESRNPSPSSIFPSPSHRAINLLSNSCDEVSLTREKRKTNQLKGRESFPLVGILEAKLVVQNRLRAKIHPDRRQEQIRMSKHSVSWQRRFVAREQKGTKTRKSQKLSSYLRFHSSSRSWRRQILTLSGSMWRKSNVLTSHGVLRLATLVVRFIVLIFMMRRLHEPFCTFMQSSRFSEDRFPNESYLSVS